MDDQRNNNDRDFRDNRDRGDRDRHYGGNRNRHNNRSMRHNNHHQGRPRSQRPLLTSAINAGGLSLIGMILSVGNTNPVVANVSHYLGWATILFCLSSLISYFAQRLRPAFVEKLSDVLFLAGLLIVVAVTSTVSGIFPIL